MFWIKQKELIAHLKEQLQVDWRGDHGIKHWARVLRNGTLIAQEERVREDVVRLFSLLHDHKRVNEDRDLDHGPRAAASAYQLKGTFFDIDDEGFKLLSYAMIYHSDGHTKGNITVLTCWDADRLDLGRVGTIPHPDYLCTKTAKDPLFISAAYQRSIL